MKKAGACFLCEQASRNLQGYNNLQKASMQKENTLQKMGFHKSEYHQEEGFLGSSKLPLQLQFFAFAHQKVESHSGLPLSQGPTNRIKHTN